MSKKKFKKKKHKKHGGRPNFSAPQPAVAVKPADIAVGTEIEEPEIVEEVKEEPKIAKTADAIIPQEEEKEYAYVRKDVKKIVIVMASIIALLIVAFIINSKTSAFYSLGNWLYKALNIQTQ